jgi:hypothetical protein
MVTSREQEVRDRFAGRYREQRVDVVQEIERRVIGADWGANGYTTIAQADDLASRLHLDAGALLLDIGAGRGWPGCTSRRRRDARSCSPTSRSKH